MRFSLYALAALVPLTACAVPHTVVSGPDGRPAYVMKCSGMGRDRQDCLAEAGKLCPAGYALVDDSSRVAGVVMTGSLAVPVSQEYLTISCK